MHFTIDQEDATTVFRLKESRLDSQNAGQLKAEFLILAQPDVETLILDLTEVQHIDSAGLSALLLAERQMAAHHGDVRLVGLSTGVQSLLTLTQLDRVFPVFPTVDQALDAEPSMGDDDDEDERSSDHMPLAPGAPSVNQIKAGAIAAGGSFGAAVLAKIMMSPYEENLDELNLLGIGDDDFDDDDEDDDFDDDLDEIDEVEDLDEEDDDEDEEEDAADAEPAPEDILEEDEFEDDDFDDEELEEDDDDDDDDL